MVESSPKHSSLSPEEYAAKKAAQDAIFAKIFGDLDSERTAKEQRYATLKATQDQEIQSTRNPNAIYINATAIIDRIYDEYTDVSGLPDRNEDLVQRLYSADDILTPTIPNVSTYFPEDFASVVYEHRQSDTVIKQGEYLAVERTGFHYHLRVDNRGQNTYGIELIDREEGMLTRMRLSGELSMGTGEAEGRMAFQDDPEVFIHPSVVYQKDASLKQVMTTIKEGEIIHLTIPQTS